jgi:hypothetical protein
VALIESLPEELIDELLAGLPDTGVPVTIVIVDELLGGSD